jgi:importin subunit alpha-6/7
LIEQRPFVLLANEWYVHIDSKNSGGLFAVNINPAIAYRPDYLVFLTSYLLVLLLFIKLSINPKVGTREKKQRKMINDLQTLCAAALRRHYHHTASVDDDGDNGQGSSSRPPVMMDGRIFEALSDCVLMSDKPLLVIEAARALIDASDAGLTPEQRGSVDFGALVDMCDSSDAADRETAGALLGEIVNSKHEDLRNSLLESLVRDVLGDDPDAQIVSTSRLALLLSIDEEPPIQRTIDGGVVPRLVEFLRREEDPMLQISAGKALMLIASGTADQAGVVFDAGAIPTLVELLQSPDDLVCESAALALGYISIESADSRDFILRNHALRPLLLLADRTPALGALQSAVYAVAYLCDGNPPPPYALVRPALPTLARLLHSSDQEVLRHACRAIRILSRESHEQIRDVVAAGVCRRMVELLLHPNSDVQMYVHLPRAASLEVFRSLCTLTSSCAPFAFQWDSYTLETVLNIVDVDGPPKQAILDHDPLSCIRGLLSSPEGEVRGRACWTISDIISRSHDQDQLDKVFEYQLVPPLVQCLADAHLDVRDGAAWAVFHITFDGTYQQTQVLVEKGCIPLLCDLLAAATASTVLIAVECIESILLAYDGLGTNPMAAHVSEAGGVAKMKDLLAHRSPDEEHDFGEVATRVLETFFGGVVGDEGEGEGLDDIAVAAAAAGPSGEAGDEGMEPPRQRHRLS